MLRLFIAIELPVEVRSSLRAAREQLETRGRLAVRWIDPDGAHLTLKFLGATPEDQAPIIQAELERAARSQTPFMLETGQLGAFPNLRAPRVVWLGVAGALERLRALQAGVERCIAPLGFPTEQRAFSPHLTLGRAEKDAGRSELAAVGAAVSATAPPRSVAWQVSQIALIRSELSPRGARYTTLARADLDMAGGAAIIPGADVPTTPADL
jgi:2'-5' RNA ligase